jgi:hypothetical protein
MNRADLQRLSNSRLREARILFAAGEYSGAYYLAGYSIECALKACFAKTVKRFDFPERDRAGKIFTHRLLDLARIAGLEVEISVATKANRRLGGGWLLVCNWTEESRYATWTRDDAEAIIDAIAKTRDGVLPWIKQRW